ncbi:hypothetical protein GXW82_28355 [Streptacidiphilus sp. 4-A2]|nr:hypothetical protein [Streptacidiphilus sp. 4-A2]
MSPPPFFGAFFCGCGFFCFGGFCCAFCCGFCRGLFWAFPGPAWPGPGSSRNSGSGAVASKASVGCGSRGPVALSPPVKPGYCV